MLVVTALLVRLNSTFKRRLLSSFYQFSCQSLLKSSRMLSHLIIISYITTLVAAIPTGTRLRQIGTIPDQLMPPPLPTSSLSNATNTTGLTVPTTVPVPSCTIPEQDSCMIDCTQNCINGQYIRGGRCIGCVCECMRGLYI